MGKKAAILLLTMMVLTGLSGWYIVGGIQAYSRYQQSSIASQEHCGGQSPVHICVQSPSEIFSAYYPDDSPLLLRSRWLMQWIAANRLKIAAWVTPDDPAVIALDNKAKALLKSQQQPIPPAMIGYANGASARAVR